MSTVGVIDYGMGNLHSVAKALERVADGTRVVVSSDPKVLLRAQRLVLPGVGAIRDCMGELRRLGLDDVTRRAAEDRPLLGVCVGLQALMDFSAENDGTQCLGLVPGKVSFFADVLAPKLGTEHLKIPHMGWNQVHQVGEHPLWQGVTQDERFYFVHSYFVEPASADLVAATSSYGVTFCAAVARDNVFAVQFHPEKSQHAGLALYRSFLSWDGTT